MNREIKINMDITEIKQAKEEANQLVKILKEAKQIIDSLSGKISKS